MPLGPNYLPSYAAGVRTGLKVKKEEFFRKLNPGFSLSQELGPKLLGKDPTSLTTLNAFMDYELKGHPYVKVLNFSYECYLQISKNDTLIYSLRLIWPAGISWAKVLASQSTPFLEATLGSHVVSFTYHVFSGFTLVLEI